jgi:DNA repair photolyase
MEIGKESKWESKCEDLMRKLERAKDINKWEFLKKKFRIKINIKNLCQKLGRKINKQKGEKIRESINTDKIAVTVTEKKWRNRCDKIGSKNSVIVLIVLIPYKIPQKKLPNL